MKKIFSFIMAAGLLVANTANAEKFFFGLQSGIQGTQELSITMDDNYNLTMQLPGTGTFDPEEFLMTVRMRGTESQKWVEGGTSTQLNLQDMLGYAYNMTGCVMTVATDVKGTQVTLTYTVARNADTISATVDDPVKAASVWADFKDKLIKSTQVTPESFFEMAAGSYIISGDERMDYENAVELLKGDWTVNGTIGKLAEGVVTTIAQSNKDVIVIKDGSKFAFGGKLAQLNSDLTLTLNYPAGTVISGRLTALKAAMTTGTPSEIVKNTVNKICDIFSETCEMVDEETITAGTVLENSMKIEREGLVEGDYYTIVCPFAPIAITGADFFKPGDYAAATGLAIDPVELKDVVAGMPYFIQATDTKLVWKYAAKADSVSLSENNGLVGVYEKYTVESEADEVYMLTDGNMLRKALTGSWLAAGRAYVKLSKIEPQPTAPGRRFIAVHNAPTSVAEVAAPAVKEGKMIRNGQLVIIRDGKMFNAQGAEL